MASTKRVHFSLILVKSGCRSDRERVILVLKLYDCRVDLEVVNKRVFFYYDNWLKYVNWRKKWCSQFFYRLPDLFWHEFKNIVGAVYCLNRTSGNLQINLKKNGTYHSFSIQYLCIPETRNCSTKVLVYNSIFTTIWSSSLYFIR